MRDSKTKRIEKQLQRTLSSLLRPKVKVSIEQNNGYTKITIDIPGLWNAGFACQTEHFDSKYREKIANTVKQMIMHYMTLNDKTE